MSKLGVTASQTVGPFLTIALKADGQEYIVPKNTEGALKLCGYVYDGEGNVVPDAVIEVWQANVFGNYNHPEDESDTQIVNEFSGFGRSCTDQDGRFFFITLKPGQVAGRGNTLQAPHIAVNVFARGMLKQQVTRIYFSDEIKSNSEDPILNSIEDESARNTLVAQLNISRDGIMEYAFDIHLQGKLETVFFDV